MAGSLAHVLSEEAGSENSQAGIIKSTYITQQQQQQQQQQ